MGSLRTFCSDSGETAAFAVREYFRPLVAAIRFLKSVIVPSHAVESDAQDTGSVDEVKAISQDKQKSQAKHV
jgi:hypothetical protein